MSSLPRHKRAQNAKMHKKSIGRISNRKMGELDSICEKHHISTLTFRSCKFATSDGEVTLVEHDQIKGNMKAGIILLKTSLMSPSETIYDLVQIEKDKKDRDEKKKLDDFEKAKIEIERLRNANIKESIPGADTQHQELLEKLMNEDTNQKSDPEKVTDEFCDQLDATVENDKPIVEDNEPIAEDNEPIIEENESVVENNEYVLDNTTNDTPNVVEDSSTKRKTKSQIKREKALKQMQEQIAQQTKKAAANEGNKYYRSFMKDLKYKFSITETPVYKYFEAKAQSTDMIIDGVRTYEISMPENVTEKYLLIIGDLQMKSNLIRQIDPAYKCENVLQEQNDFLERIKAKDTSKIRELSEDLLEEEFDDLDALGISEEEIVTSPLVGGDLSDTAF